MNNPDKKVHSPINELNQQTGPQNLAPIRTITTNTASELARSMGQIPPDSGPFPPDSTNNQPSTPPNTRPSKVPPSSDPRTGSHPPKNLSVTNRLCECNVLPECFKGSKLEIDFSNLQESLSNKPLKMALQELESQKNYEQIRDELISTVTKQLNIYALLIVPEAQEAFYLQDYLNENEVFYLALLYLKDETTARHLIDTFIIGQLFIKQQDELSDEEQFGFLRGCLLHDIGKLEVPNATLNHPGRLPEELKEIFNKHETDSAEITAALCLDSTALSEIIAQGVVATHHEYPNTIESLNLLNYRNNPHAALFTLLAFIVDNIAAMGQKRSYRNSLDAKKIYRYLMENLTARLISPYQYYLELFCQNLPNNQRLPNLITSVLKTKAFQAWLDNQQKIELPATRS